MEKNQCSLNPPPTPRASGGRSHHIQRTQRTSSPHRNDLVFFQDVVVVVQRYITDDSLSYFRSFDSQSCLNVYSLHLHADSGHGLTCVAFLRSTLCCTDSTITARTCSSATFWPFLWTGPSTCCSTCRSVMEDRSSSCSSSVSSPSAVVQLVSS